ALVAGSFFAAVADSATAAFDGTAVFLAAPGRWPLLVALPDVTAASAVAPPPSPAASSAGAFGAPAVVIEVVSSSPSPAPSTALSRTYDAIGDIIVRTSPRTGRCWLADSPSSSCGAL